MPRSRLKATLDYEQVGKVVADVSMVTIERPSGYFYVPCFENLVRKPKFWEEDEWSIVTEPVKFDTKIRWGVLSGANIPPFIIEVPEDPDVIVTTDDGYSNLSIPFGNPLNVDWPEGDYTHFVTNYTFHADHLYEGDLQLNDSIPTNWAMQGELEVRVNDAAGTNVGYAGQVLLGVGDLNNFVGIGVDWVTDKAGWGFTLYMVSYDDGTPSYEKIIEKITTDLNSHFSTTGTLTIRKLDNNYVVEFFSDELGVGFTRTKSFANEQQPYVMSTGYSGSYSILDGVLEWTNVHLI